MVFHWLHELKLSNFHHFYSPALGFIAALALAIPLYFLGQDYGTNSAGIETRGTSATEDCNNTRLATNCTNKQTNKGKKVRTQRFNEVRQLSSAYVLGAIGERDLINQSITGYKYWEQYPSLYSQRILEEKKTNGSKNGSETNSES